MTRIPGASRVLDRRRPRTYPQGRVCGEPGCDVELSIYNETDYCGLHQPEPEMHYCGMDFVVCPECGEVAQIKSRKAPPRCGCCGALREGVGV